MITLQFIPYSDIENLTPEKRIKKLLDVVKEDRILLLEGRLAKEEEAGLIRTTMEAINGRFKGIEISVVSSNSKGHGLLKKIQKNIVELLSGPRSGITIIGPATIVKEIKKDPDKIQLLTVEAKRNGLNGKRKRRK
ncbi:DUF2073 domain-containing protein [Candidatus Woesearchaeota archaeon]|nr:DUF2073 domain-containing protein [Candidatus Woesearchaeota archaeon]